MKDDKLWKAFSLFIRLRDSDDNGYGKCFTCERVIYFSDGDCGHGIGRQHKATKFDERNNHLQCKKCNGFEGGQQAIYKEEVERKYGTGTWNDIVQKSKQIVKRTQAEINELESHYKEKVKELKKTKGIS